MLFFPFLFLSLLLFEWFTVHRICVRLTSKDLLSIIGSINTCGPNFSLSLSLSSSLLLYTLLLFERFALLLPLLSYCVSDLGLHLLFLLPLFKISVLVQAVFVCVCLYAIHIVTYCVCECGLISSNSIIIRTIALWWQLRVFPCNGWLLL